MRYKGFISHSQMLYGEYVKGIKVKVNQENYKNDSPSYRGTGHASLYSTATAIWFENKFLGFGMKKFYDKCSEKNAPFCSSHPHNIYLDILITAGLIGFIPFVLFLIVLFKKIFKSSISLAGKDKLFEVKLCLLIGLIMNFFPIKSSGSMYSTYFASSSFLILSFAIYFFNKKIKRKI